MTQYYIQRNAQGAIEAGFANPQPGVATELLSDTHPDWLAFVAQPIAQPTLTLDAATLAAALIAKGLLVQADVNAAVAQGAGGLVEAAVAGVLVTGGSKIQP